MKLRKLVLLLLFVLGGCAVVDANAQKNSYTNELSELTNLFVKKDDEKKVEREKSTGVFYDNVKIDTNQNNNEAEDTLRNKYKTAIEARGYDSTKNTAILAGGDNNLFVIVNIPSQTLRVYKNGKEILRSPVIVGNPNTPTPEFVTYITGVKFNPDWTIPPKGSLERVYSEKLKSKEQIALLKSNGIVWSRREDGTYSFYQPPSDNNVLGQVRFIMHSPYNVYLHDTNRPDLYELEDRFFSSGCIRVKRWDYLASIVLDEDLDVIHKYTEGNKTRMISSKNKIPVYIVYWTVEMIDGKIKIYKDVYKKGLRTIDGLILQ